MSLVTRPNTSHKLGIFLPSVMSHGTPRNILGHILCHIAHLLGTSCRSTIGSLPSVMSHGTPPRNTLQEYTRSLPSVMSHGTPPRNTLQEYAGFLCIFTGNCPLHVHVGSDIANTPPQLSHTLLDTLAVVQVKVSTFCGLLAR